VTHDPIDPDTTPIDDPALSRRQALARLGLGAIGVALLGAAPEVSRATLARPHARASARLSSFDLADVRLLDGPFRDAQARDARYLLSLEPDRLLHNFRTNAGLRPKAPVYGGWESQEPWIGIRCHGHTLGHYLGAVSMMYAATGDARFRTRADYIVDELQACQRARGDGLVCAFPDGAKPLEDAVAGREFSGVPWYTMHKIFAGLRDAHVHGRSVAALPVLTGLAEWTWRATDGLSDAEFQRMLDREHGGMTEVLADVSVLAHEPRYLVLARRFAHQAVLRPLAEGRDTLDGLHSNTQIPKFVGYERVHELTDAPEYGAAARFFWRTVTERRSFATGGNGDGEHFFPVDEFAKRLGSAKTMETCCTHNMLRLTRALFTAEPLATYADYYERALYNGILASQDPESGMMTYFQATRPGYVKLYNTPEESFWCCTGTGMENHAKYGDSIYFHGPEALYVNLFIPSVLTWAATGLTVTQTTRFPETDVTRLAIRASHPARATIQVRHPAWCARMTVRVNGRVVARSETSSRYVALDRTWRSGDVIDVHLPMSVHAEPLPGTTDTIALLYGPIVLAGMLGRKGLTPGADIIRNERESGNMLNAVVEVPVLAGSMTDVARHTVRTSDVPLAFHTVGVGRPHEARLVPYYTVAHERYTLYWKMVPEGAASG
jgi:DUF1680 family protein